MFEQFNAYVRVLWRERFTERLCRRQSQSWREVTPLTSARHIEVVDVQMPIADEDRASSELWMRLHVEGRNAVRVLVVVVASVDASLLVV